MKTLLLLLVFITFLPITVYANNSLDLVNEKVCDRFDDDVRKLAAIMEEKKNRLGITETRVAFGGSDTPIKSADYFINFAAEAVAFQRIQKYSSKNELRSSLEVLKGKIVKAKDQVGRALDEKE